jgi:prenyltransferase beta subunit
LLEKKIIDEQSADGLWYGELSSSAVSTAVACFALQMNNSDEDRELVVGANRWLCENANEDGGWGDTVESPSNITATILAYACLSHGKKFWDQSNTEALRDAKLWLENLIGNINGANLRKAIIKKYKTDYTFSVPILSMCAISGILDESSWNDIPQLPFEAALFPQGFYKFFQLPVVSYAIPALIAVGLAQHKSRKRVFGLSAFRDSIKSKVLAKLRSIQPSHGGFLDAPPLTGFVSACLIHAGYKDSSITKKTLGFLRENFRADGSCAIDTNLAVWITSKCVKALKNSEFLKSEVEKRRISNVLLSAQFRSKHPFTGAIPGGWGWTNTPGAVPDADDTSAVLIAIHILLDGKINEQIEAGINWLINIQNRDGGIPTFCKGWGKLPFDKSCPDITAHAVEALSLWENESKQCSQISKVILRMVKYLEKDQGFDGAWKPLWFGDQNAVDHSAKVYGTSVVLTSAMHELGLEAKQKAFNYLVESQNSDGSWGGDKGSTGNIEYTAKAITALTMFEDIDENVIAAGEKALKVLLAGGKSAPIGLYFASLWYTEKMYPIVFSLEAGKTLALRAD